MSAERVIVCEVDVDILLESLPLGDERGYRNPRPSRIYEARFEWTPKMRSEDYRSFRGFGATEEEAISVLFQERERSSP